MSDNNPPVFTRRTFARDDGKGISTADWTLTQVSITDPVQIVCEPVTTLPVIFVPGIMGSNSMLTVDVNKKNKGEPVWLITASRAQPGTGAVPMPRPAKSG